MDEPARHETPTEARPSPLVVGLVLAVAAAVYVALRFALNREFEGAPWAELVALEAPLPYGHRVLVPWLSRPLVAAGLSIAGAFAIFEWLSTVGLVIAVRRVASEFAPPRASLLVAAGTFAVLPLPYLLKHRWPIFYPWDTPGMLVVVLAVGLALSKRPRWALLVTAIGAVNRETAVLVPAIYLLLRWSDEDRRRTVAFSVLMVVVFVVVRESIAVALPDNPGAPIRWMLEGEYRIVTNLRWLSDPRRVLTFVGGLAAMPIAWVVMWKHIPSTLRRLSAVVGPAFVGLLFVANVYEPRAFGEVIALSYLAVAVAVWRFVSPP